MNAAMPTNSPPTPEAGVLITHTPEDLAQIHRPDCSLVLWQRPRPDRWLLAPASEGRPWLKAELSLDDLPGMLESRLGTSEGMRWLARDILVLSRHFSQISGHERIDISLGPVSRQECPYYHVDNVNLRLLCTYLGAGTEYLDETQVDRDWLGQGQNEKVCRGLEPRQAPTMAVLLMKGAAYPGQPGKGQVHRSPAHTPERSARLRLCIDGAHAH
ncbi:DUF1826 domain-containing protein [Thioalkalivibrio sulfidiphilus]|uniref:DUF1826 domain-containing protein n=1 Tax=Thioalkalivibrio sulfidiphilus TaxID=1033854 RepID=UPI003B2B813E